MKIGKCIGLALLALAATPLWADPSITAKVSNADISINDSITLTIEISGVGNIGSAPTPTIAGFQIQPAGQTQSYQWVNGQSSSLIGFNYILTPTSVGSFNIPAIELNHDGKIYTTTPIPITVRAGGNAGPSGEGSSSGPKSVDVPSEGLKPVFVTAKVDSSKVYVGEQIYLTIQFLRRPGVRFGAQPRYSEPDMTGFLVEPLKQQEYSTSIQGTQYDVTEIRYALFPIADGDYAIGSASVQVAIQAEANPYDPNSFFQSFFGRMQTMKLTTRAIPLQVRGLPKSKPVTFSGAVGRYKISSALEKSAESPEVGKPVNLIVTIQGVGNIKALKEPAVPPMSAFRRYETISNTKLDNTGKFIHGSKEFKFLLVPQVSGHLTIPGLAYTFFNPEMNQFQTETTPEISLQVKPGNLSQMPQESALNATGTQVTEGVKVVERDIRFVKPGKISAVQSPLFQRQSFYILNALPLIFAFGALVTSWQNKNRLINPEKYRFRGAHRQAKKLLRTAIKLKSAPDPVPYYGALYEAIAFFIGNKLGISAHGLVWDEVDRRLAEKGASTELRDALKQIKDEADMVRFASSEFTDDMKESSLNRTRDVLEKLNKVLIS